MNDIIKQMIDGYMNAFSMYEIKSPGLQTAVDDYKARLVAFASSVTDPAAFYTDFMNSGLQEEYSGLISKVAMASMNGTNDAGGVEVPKESPKLPTVREFVDQYRTAYNEVCRAGYRKRGKAAYEAVFAVANRTDDLLEAQTILEKERLLWKIVSEDSLDIYDALLDAMDPLDEAVAKPIALQRDVYLAADGDEALTYLTELLTYPRIAAKKRGEMQITIFATLAFQLVEYCKARLEILEWTGDNAVQLALNRLVVNKFAARRTLAHIKAALDLSFDDILQNEAYKIRLLNPAAADAFGRVKTALSPANYEVFADAVKNEILPDLPVMDILYRQTALQFRRDLDHRVKDKFEDKAQKRAQALNASLAYYQHPDLQQQARAHLAK